MRSLATSCGARAWESSFYPRYLFVLEEKDGRVDAVGRESGGVGESLSIHYLQAGHGIGDQLDVIFGIVGDRWGPRSTSASR